VVVADLQEVSGQSARPIADSLTGKPPADANARLFQKMFQKASDGGGRSKSPYKEVNPGIERRVWGKSSAAGADSRVVFY